MTRRRLASALLLSGLLALPFAAHAAAQSPANGLADTAWMLSEITTDGTTTPIPSGQVVSLQFDAEIAGGTTGCNRYTAGYTTDGTALTFGPIASTMMFCEEPAMTFEGSYLAALGSVAAVAQTDDSLTLSDAAGVAVLVYGAAAADSVYGPWNVTSINNGNEAVVTTIEGSGLTVAFHEDGTVEGFGGCNSFSGGYSVDGDAIAIGPLMSTMMACEEAISTQEAQYLIALQDATTWKIQDGSLELRDDAGALQVQASSAIGN